MNKVNTLLMYELKRNSSQANITGGNMCYIARLPFMCSEVEQKCL